MNKGFVKSVVLHIIILVIIGFGTFEVVKREIVPSHPIPIMFDKIEKEAVPQQKAKPKPKLKKKKPTAKPKIKTKPKPKSKKPDTKKEAVKIPEKTKTVEQMKKKDFSSILDEIEVPEEQKPEKSFDNVLKDLTPDEFKPEVKETDEQVPESIMDKLRDNFSIAEEDALRAQIRDNWLVPVGVKDIEKMAVDIKIKVAKGGEITSTKVVKNKYFQRGNPTYEVFVRSAKMAVLKSSPLKLSDERMKVENEITFHFSPIDMFY